MRTIQNKLILITTIPLILFLVIFFIVIYNQSQNNITERISTLGSIYTKHIAKNSKFALFTKDIKYLEVLSNDVLSQKNVIRVEIFNKNMKKILNSEKNNFEIIANANIHTFSESVISLGIELDDTYKDITLINNLDTKPNVVGHIKVTISDYYIKKETYDIFRQISLYIALITMLGIIIAIHTSRRISKPLLNLVNASKEIEVGNLNVKISTDSAGELGILESAFNSMKRGLQEYKTEMTNKIEDATNELVSTINMLEKKNTQFRSAEDKAIKASKAKGEFLANMSHEIRTPLNGIIGYIELLKSSTNRQDNENYINVISQSSRILANIINDILTFSRIENNKLSIKKHQFDIMECLENTVLLHTPFACDNKLELILTIYHDMPRIIVADELRITEIISNILNNAIKFTAKGYVHINADFNSNSIANKNQLIITVTDTGNGIPENKLDELFIPFHQLNTSTMKKHSGTGLGLSICKRLIDMMDGNISVKSKSDKGTKFTLTIPIENYIHSSTNWNLNGTKIILCDSHSISRRSIRTTLLHLNSELQTCTTLEQLYNSVTNHKDKYDVMIISMDHSKNDINHVYMDVRSYYQGPILFLFNEFLLKNQYLFINDPACLYSIKPIKQSLIYEKILELTEKTAINSADITNDENKHSPLYIPPYRSYNFLVVEDNLFNRNLLYKLLTDIGASVSLAENGQQATEMCTTHVFDMIFMDIHMPLMDGLTASKKIKAHGKNTDTHIIAVSADVFIEDNNEEHILFKDVLTKPINTHHLYSILQTLLPEAYYKPQSDIEFTSSNTDPLANIPDDLKDQLLDELPVHIKNLSYYYDKNDYVKLQEHAHHLAGVIGYFNINILNAHQRDLRQSIKDNDDEAIGTHLNELNIKIIEMVSMYKKEKNHNTLEQYD